MRLIGVYSVAERNDVYLIEIELDCSPENLEVGKITQAVDGLSEGSWQSPWEEKYLDENGEKVIGDYFNVPSGGTRTRLIFYFHFIDFEKPLWTQFGEVRLDYPVAMPDRLKVLTEYVEPD